MPQTPILTVTLNPALDISAFTARVSPGPKLRLDGPRHDPGGGGINVARAIVRLGGRAEALAVLGGAMGARIAALLEAEGVPLLPFDTPEETRHSLSVTDLSDGRQYRFVLPGEPWPEGRAVSVLDRIDQAARPGGFVVLSGSQPPGVPDDFPHHLAARLGERARMIADISGAALRAALTRPARPALAVLRLDQAAAEDAAGGGLEQPADSAAFARTLVDRRIARMVVLARGADGNVLAGAGLLLHCRPPEVPVKSPVGAGDSFTAAFTLALARDEGPEDALRAGTAAAAATVMTEGTELCRAEDAARLGPQCHMQRL
ncbi:1-phosphofructokinase family hexose kinase [Alkalilacustris brevis]|uniref:1-phosphofructokinase family hexose kinase n=1 Tax=Alkalilacustris brevis TaxID=2026338 RepID=UPI000E0D57B6|nr:hexose kinase [Alkalilacustris brevis]